MGGPLETREDKFLFFVDKRNEKDGKTKKQYWRSKLLSYEKKLMPNPAIEPLSGTKRKKSSEPSVHENKKLKKIEKAIANKSETVSIDQRKKQDYDLWAADAIPDPNTFVPMKEKIKTPPKFTPSKLPAVEVENPGGSYNPKYEDHQNELGEALAQELSRIEKEKHLEEKLKVPKLKRAKRSRKEDQEEEDESNSKETVHINLPNTGKKTRAERNRQLRKSEITRRTNLRKVLKSKKVELSRISDLVGEIDDQEEKKENKRHLKRQAAELYPNQTEKLGKYKFQKESKQVLLTEELPQHLRSLKATIDPMHDRFHNLQKRNLIEVRYRVGPGRRAKRKDYEKRNLRE